MRTSLFTLSRRFTASSRVASTGPGRIAATVIKHIEGDVMPATRV